MSDLPVIFYILLFIVAFAYASVGHGGASGYLALMAIFQVSPVIMKPSALILNIFVSLTAFAQYFRNGNFNWRIFGILALASTPAAFAGGMVNLDPTLYKRILGIILLFVVIRLAGFKSGESPQQKDIHLFGLLLIGGCIGFVSGLIGIGGGIILTPLLILLAWCKMKEAAGISALFIAVNSCAGLAGAANTGIQLGQNIYPFIAVAFAGGLLGSYFGASYFSSALLRRILAVVLLIAALKLLFT